MLNYSHILYNGVKSYFVAWNMPSRRLSKKSGSSATWMQRHVSDPYVKAAVAQDLRSRSAFKLIQIQEKHKFIKPNHIVVDLGASPGGWSLHVSKLLLPQRLCLKNVVATSEHRATLPHNSIASSNSNADRDDLTPLVAVDLLPMDPVPNCRFIEGDFTKNSVQAEISAALGHKGCDVLLSDMLQNTCGRPSDDHFRSVDLVYSVLAFGSTHVRVGGTVLAKFLRGADEQELLAAARKEYLSVKVVKPDASRKESAEVYLLAVGKRPASPVQSS